jgi:alkylhydroperoxidase family enzyme
MEVVKREGELILCESGGEGKETPAGLTERQWAVICYTDEMTRNVQVRDGTFARLRELFTDREVVEITATVGFSILDWSG